MGRTDLCSRQAAGRRSFEDVHTQVSELTVASLYALGLILKAVLARVLRLLLSCYVFIFGVRLLFSANLTVSCQAEAASN